MARVNTPKQRIRTHEGGVAKHINPELALRRSVLACMLWERSFYEEGEEISKRIADLIAKVDPEKVAALAVETRTVGKLRHTPLLMVREMARLKTHRHLVAQTLAEIIQRADELAEFLAIYWKDGRQPLSAQVKKGLASAFTKFSAYNLAKYNRDGDVKLRDVLFLCHAKPKDAEQEAVWKRLVDGTLESPDTWEVALSSGKDKKETWERLIAENKLGALALLRNLRNMKEAGVSDGVVGEALAKMDVGRILPFRFIAAATHAPQWEDKLEPPMLQAVAGREKLPGKTALLIDVSGSMVGTPISRKADMDRLDATCALAILAREMCDSVEVYTFSESLVQVAPRRGFALGDAIKNSQPNSGTHLGAALKNIPQGHDRIIVFTDEQSADDVPDPTAKGYMINVAAEKNGVGYGAWRHIDGFSEGVLDWITAHEQMTENNK